MRGAREGAWAAQPRHRGPARGPLGSTPAPTRGRRSPFSHDESRRTLRRSRHFADSASGGASTTPSLGSKPGSPCSSPITTYVSSGRGRPTRDNDGSGTLRLVAGQGRPACWQGEASVAHLLRQRPGRKVPSPESVPAARASCSKRCRRSESAANSAGSSLMAASRPRRASRARVHLAHACSHIKEAWEAQAAKSACVPGRPIEDRNAITVTAVPQRPRGVGNEGSPPGRIEPHRGTGRPSGQTCGAPRRGR